MAMRSVHERMTVQLARRSKQGTLRSLMRLSSDMVDFSSNDYLGLAREKKIESNSFLFNGSTGSRLLSGNHKEHEEAENYLSKVFCSESSLVFNSGYSANLSILSSVPNRRDTIIYDENSHASIKDGARLSTACKIPFRHNNLTDLKNKIKRASGNVFVVVESVYSMDGDLAPLVELAALCEKYDCALVVDEAHSTGLYGPGGAGLSVMLNLQNLVFARVMGFGKAIGCQGAVVCGSVALVEYLLNFARPFIYSTALPPRSILTVVEAFKYLSENHSLQERLTHNIKLYKELIKQDLGITLRSNHAVQPFLMLGSIQAIKAASALREANFDVRPILSPTVREGEEILRICLHSFNSEEEIYGLVKYLKKALK